MNQFLMLQAKKRFAQAFNDVIEPLKALQPYEIPDKVVESQIWYWSHYKPLNAFNGTFTGKALKPSKYIMSLIHEGLIDAEQYYKQLDDTLWKYDFNPNSHKPLKIKRLR